MVGVTAPGVAQCVAPQLVGHQQQGYSLRGDTGLNSATGVPFRVTMMLCPACTSRRMAAGSFF